MGRTCSEFSKFREPNKSLNHEGKDPVSHMCLVGVVVAYWYLTQETASLSPFTVMINIFVTEFAESKLLLQKACSVPCVDLNQENNCANDFVCQKCFEVTIVRYLLEIHMLFTIDRFIPEK